VEAQRSPTASDGPRVEVRAGSLTLPHPVKRQWASAWGPALRRGAGHCRLTGGIAPCPHRLGPGDPAAGQRGAGAPRTPRSTVLAACHGNGLGRVDDHDPGPLADHVAPAQHVALVAGYEGVMAGHEVRGQVLNVGHLLP
jgi:hypothetical protein